MTRNKKLSHYFVIGAFATLYIITSLISTIHVIDFFALTNPYWLAIGLAIAFEVGAAASLASIIALQKMNKTMVWLLFLILTSMQAMGNTYYAYVHAKNYSNWIELFGLVEEDIIYQKRILALISGAILPIVALGFIKALVDYLKPNKPIEGPQSQYIKGEDSIFKDDIIEEEFTPDIINSNNAESKQYEMSIDEKAARGLPIPSLKRPHDP